MSFTERTELLIGAKATSLLSSSYVLIVGIGGVGSNCALSLARAGVGHFCLVDYDAISRSNINRQAHAFESTIGRPKLDVMREMILDINPNAFVRCIDMQVLPEDVKALFAKASSANNDTDVTASPLSFCIDTADLVTTKVALALACEERSIPYIAGIGSGNKLDPQQMEFADIFNTRVCRMCKAVRKEARRAGLTHMNVLYSPEKPLVIEADAQSRMARSNIGTISYYPTIMGNLLASWVIRKLISK